MTEAIGGERIVEPGHGGRYVLIGPTNSGRMLAIILEPEGAGVFFRVTARPASRKERRRYETTRGGGPA